MRDGSYLAWDLRDDSEARAFWLGAYDNVLRDWLLRVVTPAAVIVDAGANVGAWTIPLARHVRSGGGRVIAFEPVPENLLRLRAALALNASCGAVDVHEVALGDHDGIAWLWLKRRETGATTGTAALVPPGAGDVWAPEIRLDSWATRHPLHRLDLLKMDVDGAELQILGGGQRTIDRFRPLVLAELDDYWLSTHGQTPDDALRWASDCDYVTLFWCGGVTPGFRERRTARTRATLFIPAERAVQLTPRLLHPARRDAGPVALHTLWT